MTNTTARPSRPARMRHAVHRYLRTVFRYLSPVLRYLRSRPTAGCLILAAGGWFVLRPVVASTFQFLNYLGVGGAQIYILGGGMVAAALVAFFAPAQRHFPALMAMAFSIASLPLANLGGWLIGMVLGIVGSGMVFAWTPYSEAHLARFDAKRARREQRREARGKHGKGLAAA